MSLRKFIRRGIGLLGFLWFVSVYAYPIPDSIAVRLQGFVWKGFASGKGISAF